MLKHLPHRQASPGLEIVHFRKQIQRRLGHLLAPYWQSESRPLSDFPISSISCAAQGRLPSLVVDTCVETLRYGAKVGEMPSEDFLLSVSLDSCRGGIGPRLRECSRTMERIRVIPSRRDTHDLQLDLGSKRQMLVLLSASGPRDFATLHFVSHVASVGSRLLVIDRRGRSRPERHW